MLVVFRAIKRSGLNSDVKQENSVTVDCIFSVKMERSSAVKYGSID